MQYNKEDLAGLDRVPRLKLINSVTGIKPGNLMGTIDGQGRTNLAIFSSVVHLGSDPALLGFIARPQTEEVGHTLENIKQTGRYTINHIHPEFIGKAHFTSAKFERDVSEFARCGLTEEYLGGFDAPFVKESHFKMGLRFRETLDIALNGTTLVIGEIELLEIPEAALTDGDIDLERAESVGISGLNRYYKVTKVTEHPYARVDEVPDFKEEDEKG